MLPTDTRVAWPDAARGLAIVLVVLHHSTLYALQLDLADPIWRPITELLRSMRMPLFFLAAGLFATKWANASWGDLFRSKVLLLGWVFAIWVPIRWIWFNLDPNQTVEDGVWKLFLRYVWPSGGWFLLTLAVFFVLLKATRQAPAWAQLAVAGTVSAFSLSGVIHIGNQAWDGTLAFYFFFLVGAHGRNFLLPSVSRIPAWASIAMLITGLGIVAAIGYFDFDELFGFPFMMRLFGVAAGIGAARALSGSPLLRHLGQNTLAIYMVHSLLIATMMTLILALPGVPAGAKYVVPIAVALLALTASYWIGVLAKRRPFTSWLFDTPDWLRPRSADKVTR